MKRTGLILLIAAIAGFLCVATALSAEKTTVTADQAEKMLKDGNRRFVKDKVEHPRRGELRIKEVSPNQNPFAVILGCSDSRVPLEVIFDQGLGDLFVVRLAGNIVDVAALASIEYAVGSLGVPLVVVLGHKSCGAVAAALRGGEVPGHLSILVKAIQPAVDETKGKPGDPLDNAVRANVKVMVNKLRTSEPILAPAVKAGKVKVIGAYYDLDTGVVSFMPSSQVSRAPGAKN